jgi:hypothetical protein
MASAELGGEVGGRVEGGEVQSSFGSGRRWPIMSAAEVTEFCEETRGQGGIAAEQSKGVGRECRKPVMLSCSSWKDLELRETYGCRTPKKPSVAGSLFGGWNKSGQSGYISQLG